MLERPDRFFGRKEPDEEEAKKAKDFGNLIESCFTSPVLNEAKFGIRAHFNRIELGFTLGRGGNRRYFFEETIIENGKIYKDIYLADNNIIIHVDNEKLSGSEGKISGKKVDKEKIQVLREKIERFKNLFEQ
jgi:hypothetical protein